MSFVNVKTNHRRQLLPLLVEECNGPQNSGQVKLRTKYFLCSSFIWQYRVTTSAAWLTAATTVKATFVLSGLSSAVRYSFRVAVVSKTGREHGAMCWNWW